MYVAQPGHIDHLKQVNAGRVYKLIDQLGPISRIDLSKESNLAPASITKITRELLDAHLIKETQVQEANSRGRPAIGLEVDNEGWQFLSLRLGRGYLTIALHSLGGEQLIEERQLIKEIEQDELLAKLLNEINVFFQKHSKILGRITSIAVSLPGLVISSQGLIIQMPHYNVKNLPLGPKIYESTGLPVFIGNDTRSWALAEKLFGNSKNIDNSILVSIHHGVGAGIIMNGEVLQGRTGNIGEMGHIKINKLGARCHCGNTGCLETVASAKAIRDQVKNLINNGHQTVLKDQTITIENICLAANQGDVLAKQVITELGHNLGEAIAIMVNLFNPEMILIGGEINLSKDILYPIIMDSIQNQVLPLYAKDTQLVESRFYTQATMPGAALVKQAMCDGSLLMKVIEG
ncbi:MULTISPECIES: ROK family protein [Aliivibrio]|uniref:DNA-binding transcriptional repressor n=3 Tax=Aliivibrio fischeri TaxID=668 RepID=Q5E080_ALIF1|nr:MULTISPECIES: ROK family protein [Aliivibrio]AAW87566.1 DNA-binding transcriptional repressor [Aliivibrio fischeri ES114]ACH63574.1 protein mlc (Making large colonies protein) [Aliivibrio fischeri MJ11]KLU78270.1 transcriptional regulator [Aliivibrio fischeri]MBD1570809.1 ROK family protein [Aliivibrio sp. S10_S31]MCE7535503.1 ROK family protein [Aliivibrio fischeri]